MNKWWALSSSSRRRQAAHGARARVLEPERHPAPDCFLHGGTLHRFEYGIPAASLLPLRPSPRRLSVPALRPSARRCTRRREALQRWGIAIPPTSPVCRSPRFFGSTRCRLSSPLARSASATGSACVLRERSETVFCLVVWLCLLYACRVRNEMRIRRVRDRGFSVGPGWLEILFSFNHKLCLLQVMRGLVE